MYWVKLAHKISDLVGTSSVNRNFFHRITLSIKINGQSEEINSAHENDLMDKNSGGKGAKSLAQRVIFFESFCPLNSIKIT